MWSEMKQQQQQQRLKPATWSSLLRSSKEIVRQQQSLIADQGLKIRSIIARYRIIPIYVVYYVVYGASKAIFGKLAKIRLSSLLLPPNFIPHNISSRFLLIPIQGASTPFCIIHVIDFVVVISTTHTKFFTEGNTKGENHLFR